MSDVMGRVPAHYAALNNDEEALKYLSAAGADLGASDLAGFTPLHFACQESSLEAARFLVRSGAAVDATNKYGNSPLWTAVFAYWGSGEIIKLLLSNGANPHLANEAGKTPLELARLIANYDVAQYFESGAASE